MLNKIYFVYSKLKWIYLLVIISIFLLPISIVHAENCEDTENTCTQPGGTKIVDGVSITSDCWEYHYTKTCHYPSDNNCESLRQSGCEQTNSSCQTWINNTCVVQDESYRCPIKTCAPDSGIVCGEETYCMDDHCSPTEDTKSKPEDFNQAISNMAAVGSSAQDIASSNGVHAFGGEAKECSDDMLGFKNCCRDDGWGIDINLARCTDEEKQLGTNKGNGLTVYAGEYCHNKVLGVCTSHHKVYCVFGSKLARIIQNQGREGQLGIGFGNVSGDTNNPDCRGLSPDELSRINFGKINFSEVIDDLKNNVQFPDTSKTESTIQARIKEFYDQGHKHE